MALYLLAHVALRLRIGGGLGRGRPVATILLLGLLPLAREAPALTALGLGLVAAVCAALIAYEALHYAHAHDACGGRALSSRLVECSDIGSKTDGH